MKTIRILWAALAALFVLLCFVVWLCIDTFNNTTDAFSPRDYVEISHSTTPTGTAAVQPTTLPSNTDNPTLSPTNKPANTEKPDNGLFCTLSIKNKNITVSYGVEEATLEKNPGWLESSVAAGQEGMCVIYGHRNRTHFRVLENVVVGDSITVTMADGTVFTYNITDITTYENTSELILPALDGKTIVLVTCYPFRYSGHAPGKCVVTGVID